MLVQGNVEAMVTEDRLAAAVAGEGFLGIQDGRNRVFPLRSDSEGGRTYIANAVETSLIDRLPPDRRDGGDRRRRHRRTGGTGGARYAAEMTRLYRAGIDAVARGGRPAPSPGSRTRSNGGRSEVSPAGTLLGGIEE
ncbi:hypothetical protein [Methanoculleus chikugoensis]|uniref:hypothetical protein n=1 Tax=Methanoculleus chikugoensis TaxID=118126 RepID=UPI0006D23277|nr:hypothetical protein [Methanoculleus chikugoensis]